MCLGLASSSRHLQFQTLLYTLHITKRAKTVRKWTKSALNTTVFAAQRNFTNSFCENYVHFGATFVCILVVFSYVRKCLFALRVKLTTHMWLLLTYCLAASSRVTTLRQLSWLGQLMASWVINGAIFVNAISQDLQKGQNFECKECVVRSWCPSILNLKKSFNDKYTIQILHSHMWSCTSGSHCKPLWMTQWLMKSLIQYWISLIWSSYKSCSICSE